MYNLTYVDKRELKYINRKVRLDQSFEWNKENIQKILEVNKWLWKLTAELKKELTELNNAFRLLSETDPSFKSHLTEEQQNIKFHYFMHTVFVDDNILSLEDLVRMREEDFKVCLEIN